MVSVCAPLLPTIVRSSTIELNVHGNNLAFCSSLCNLQFATEESELSSEKIPSSSSSPSSPVAERPGLVLTVEDGESPQEKAPLSPSVVYKQPEEKEALRLYRHRLKEQLHKLIPGGCDTRRENHLETAVRVFGREVTLEDRLFCARVQRSIEDAENPAFSQVVRSALTLRRIRGTYFIRGVDAGKRHLLASANRPEQIPALGIRHIAVFKPADEVRGGAASHQKMPAKLGIKPKWEIPHELMATGLCVGCCKGMEVSLRSKAFTAFDHEKILQENVLSQKYGFLMPYIENAKELKTLIESGDNYKEILEKIPRDQFERLVLFDLSTHNTDRHEGNLLVLENGTIIPIDQALLFPQRCQTPALLAWMDWQCAQLPFSESAQAAVRNLNFAKDAAKIWAMYPTYPAGHLETMRIAYYLVKKGVQEGLTPFQIGCFMGSRTGMTSPLGEAYKRVRASSATDPEAVFMKIAGWIDKMTVIIKKEFDSIVKEANEQLVDENREESDFFKVLHDHVEKFFVRMQRNEHSMPSVPLPVITAGRVLVSPRVRDVACIRANFFPSAIRYEEILDLTKGHSHFIKDRSVVREWHPVINPYPLKARGDGGVRRPSCEERDYWPFPDCNRNHPDKICKLWQTTIHNTSYTISRK